MPTMKHPDGGTAMVSPDQVAIYEQQGWQVAPGKKKADPDVVPPLKPEPDPK